MAKARAIVKRLKAVRNIRKITRTMELIATGRFKRAMDRATEAAEYTRKISEIVADLARADLTFSHPLLEAPPEVTKTALLIVCSNRGLCGGYNAGILRQAFVRIREAEAAGQELQIDVCGKRGIKFLNFQKVPIRDSHTHFEDKPTFDEADVLATRYVEDYIRGDLHRLDVAYMEFESSSRQVPVVHTLLPISSLGSEEEEDEAATSSAIDYEFLPSAEEILQEIVPAAFKARFFKCFLDAAVSEQIFRMVAMKGATENASEMIGNLSQQYNRARQTQITSELAEIIGGAAALE